MEGGGSSVSAAIVWHIDFLQSRVRDGLIGFKVSYRQVVEVVHSRLVILRSFLLRKG